VTSSQPELPFPPPPCDPRKPSDQSPVPHEYRYHDDEYGSLADGGSYEIYICIHCRRRAYVQLPD